MGEILASLSAPEAERNFKSGIAVDILMRCWQVDRRPPKALVAFIANLLNVRYGKAMPTLKAKTKQLWNAAVAIEARAKPDPTGIKPSILATSEVAAHVDQHRSYKTGESAHKLVSSWRRTKSYCSHVMFLRELGSPQLAGDSLVLLLDRLKRNVDEHLEIRRRTSENHKGS